MRCPFCRHAASQVLDSRDTAETTRRRRACMRCRKRFTTYERVESITLLVVKKDGRREAYSREKLRLGIVRACEKLPISSERIDATVARIEQQLGEARKGEVSSRDIGDLIMKELRKLHKVAYIRFAAVYREFADLGDFEDELHKLLKRTRKRK
jgi:transcriptional repressor NrdR